MRAANVRKGGAGLLPQKVQEGVQTWRFVRGSCRVRNPVIVHPLFLPATRLNGQLHHRSVRPRVPERSGALRRFGGARATLAGVTSTQRREGARYHACPAQQQAKGSPDRAADPPPADVRFEVVAVRRDSRACVRAVDSAPDY